MSGGEECVGETISSNKAQQDTVDMLRGCSGSQVSVA